MDEIDVFIVGRNEIVREGLRRILAGQGFLVKAAVPDPVALGTAADSISPQLIIVDASSADEGISTCAHLRESFTTSRIVMMAEDYALETISRAFAVGVDGFLVKAISCEPLVGALKLIALGEKVLPSQTVNALVDPRYRPTSSNWEASRAGVNLSDREIEILSCLIRGDANKLISRRLTITEATVKVHIKAILRKLHVLNRTQAAIWAVNRGLYNSDSMISSRMTPGPSAPVTARL